MSQSSGFPRRLPGTGTFVSLIEPDFRWFFAGNLAFFMAMQMQFVLRGYLAFELTGSASALGLIAVAISLPMLLVGPVAGVVADRVNKKTLLITTQASAAVASLIPAMLIISGRIEFWHLLVVSVLTGIFFSFNMPARSALVPLLVPQHRLMNAISLQMGGMNLTRIIAPAAAGVLVAPLGVGGVYLLTTILFLIAVLSEFHLPSHGLTGISHQTSAIRELADGLRYVRRDQLVAVLVLASLLMPLFTFPVQQVLPVFAVEVFATGPSGLGLLAAMSGVGGLIGAVVSANLDGQPAKGRIMFVGGITMATFLILFAVTASFGLALLFIAAAGVGQMLFMATNNTVIQARVPEEMRGRVNSLMLMSIGVMPLSVLPLTAIADVVGAPATIAVSSAILLLMVLGLFAAVRPLRDLHMEALARVDLSRAKAAELVAAGKLTQAEADRLSGLRPSA
jgi:MFS family permease